MRVIKFFTIHFLLFSISACCNHHCETAHKIQSEIGKTVLLFAEAYGTGRMDEAASITSTNFREGMPGSVRVAKVWPKLKAYEYKKIKTDILSIEIDGDKAVVIVQAKISTAGGDAVQKEIYSLIRFQGKWLVDDLQVMEDVKTTGAEV